MRYRHQKRTTPNTARFSMHAPSRHRRIFFPSFIPTFAIRKRQSARARAS